LLGSERNGFRGSAVDNGFVAKGLRGRRGLQQERNQTG
jgi:hypothetical protein